MTKAPIAVALDAPDVATAVRWARAAGPHVSTVKVGLELFCRYGPAAVEAVVDAGDSRLFLDLKLHDIPATVAGAAGALAGLKPDIVTVHAAGGAAMVAAACEALPDTTIAAVTVLTSLSGAELSSVSIMGTSEEAVWRRASTAVSAGAGALVCSPQEVAMLREEVGEEVLLITPGVRPVGTVRGDQARVATPQEALGAGADLLVIGRPITGADDPGAAAARIAAQVDGRGRRR